MTYSQRYLSPVEISSKSLGSRNSEDPGGTEEENLILGMISVVRKQAERERGGGGAERERERERELTELGL